VVIFENLGKLCKSEYKAGSRVVKARARSPCPSLVFWKFRSFVGNFRTAQNLSPAKECVLEIARPILGAAFL
jgi:hypothetical protein